MKKNLKEKMKDIVIVLGNFSDAILELCAILAKKPHFLNNDEKDELLLHIRDVAKSVGIAQNKLW